MMSNEKMTRGDMKVSLKEIEEFLKEVNPYKAPKITKRDLK